MLGRDAIFDIIVKVINFSKLPTFYFILSIVGVQSAEVVHYSTNMSLVFWVCSILSFGYQDFINRELTFIEATSDRIKYLVNNLLTFLLYLVSSVIIVCVAPLFLSVLNTEIYHLDKFIIIAAIGLFFKNTISNIARSLGAFKAVYIISLSEFILFCLVGIILWYTTEEGYDELYLNIGASGYIFLMIIPFVLNRIDFKIRAKIYLKNILSLSILSSLIYLNIFWGTSYFIKTKFGSVSYNEAFLYDVIFIGIGPVIAMTLSFLHIKNIICRKSDILRQAFTFGSSVSVFLILVTYPFIADFRFIILICLLCLVFAVEAFGFNDFSIAVFSAYAMLVFTAAADHTAYALGFLLLFGLLIPFYPKFVNVD